MPVYEYVCMSCEHRFERLLAMRDATPACPNCGREDTRRQLSLFAAARADGGSATACACGGACACAR